MEQALGNQKTEIPIAPSITILKEKEHFHEFEKGN